MVVVKKILTRGMISFMIFFIAFRPGSAGDVMSAIAGGIVDVAQGFGDFFNGLVA
jgi:hypothetical protein